MSVKYNGIRATLVAVFCTSLQAGCAFIAPELNSMSAASFPEEQSQLIELTQQQRELLAVLEELPEPDSLPAAPAIDLSLLFADHSLSIDNVLLRWRLADMQLNATRKEMDYLISLVVNDEELQRRFKPTSAEFEPLQNKLLQCVQALELQLSPVQQHMNRLNDSGWSYVSISGHDPDAELRGVGVGGIEGLPMRERNADQLIEAIRQLSVNLRGQAADIVHVERDITAIAAAQPAGKPLDAPITSRFGARSDPFTGRRSVHKGLDIGAPKGTSIFAVAAGRVKFSGVKRGFGRIVEIDHGNGYITRYAHNSKNVVKNGELIARGQKLAEVGKTGRSTGAHLHFEVLRNGKAIDPLRFVRASL